MNLYTHKDGILALKPERQEACKVAGVIVLEFGEHMPKDGILVADTRPKGFVGSRGPNDPAATMLYVGGTFNSCKKTLYFENFERALKKALKLCE
jgi:hypothetical protein